MSGKEEITRAIRTDDGRVLIEQPDGSFRPVEGETDWARVAAMSEDELEATIADDPEDPGNDPSYWEDISPVWPQRKTQVTVRLDADLLEWFRRQGRGYQTRINAILRGYYEAHKES